MCYYKNLYIYYFSGTGNALSAAKWIKENGEKENINTIIQSIEKLKDFKLDQPEGKSLIAFTYPTHGFAAPWLMLKFLWKFPRISNANVLFVNTKAGAKIGKFFIPGMTGLAQWLSIFIFWFKGYSVKGSLPLDMPHSWTSFFPPNLKSSSIQITVRCHSIVDKMCNRIFSGGRYFRYTVWTQLWFDILVSWIVPLYIFIGRFFLAKTLFASYKCNNCRICEENCPVNAIEIRNGRPFWKYTCESCMRCMNICPQKAIQAWITRILLISYLFITAGMTYTHLSEYLLFVIVSILLFPIYWLFIKLMHVKIINILFTYTSLTRYWKRYIALEIKLKDLKHTNHLP
jgi:Pyruvate/2-oxoacid:ferredoxin oxidoreductase delta subunit/flavodoxin